MNCIGKLRDGSCCNRELDGGPYYVNFEVNWKKPLRVCTDCYRRLILGNGKDAEFLLASKERNEGDQLLLWSTEGIFTD